MIAYAALIALQAVATPTVVPAASPDPAPATTAPTRTASATPNPADKVICQEDETLGTRLGRHKVCMTKAQWRAKAVDERDALKHAQDNLGTHH